MEPSEEKKKPEPITPSPRITIVSNITHQAPGEEAVSVVPRFHRNISSDEQPYQRRKSIGSKPEPLDFGWLKDNAGLVIIQNDEGSFLQRNPTEEEREEVSGRILSLLLVSGDVHHTLAHIRPGEASPPLHVDEVTGELWLTGCADKVKYTITVFPR
jgi:hypothetical protein